MTDQTQQLLSTGIRGLDDILGGGLQRSRTYLLEGVPGSGKTTVALQFLMAGAARCEPVLHVTLSESEEELHAIAKSHGWSLEGITVRQVVPEEAMLDAEEQSTMFHPAEVELANTTKRILSDVERIKPTCIVFDSLSELRMLSGGALRFRRQMLAMKQYLARRHCTALLLDDMTSADRDLQIHSIAHAVILLDQLNPAYGIERRRVRVVKYRGTAFRGGYHDFVIRTGGIEIFPQLVAAEHRQHRRTAQIRSEIGELDRLLGGGLEEGMSTLIVGAAGTGKSTIAAKFVTAAAQSGGKGAMFLFDEKPETLLARSEALHVELRGVVEKGLVAITQVDPAEMSPGELIARIRQAVEEFEARVVVIDSLNGYLNAVPEERFMAVQLHELLTYLGQRGVATILIGAHQGLVGSQMSTPVDASYLADAIILLRYFEARGEVRQAISVIKKRGSVHERTIREFSFQGGEIRVGEALRDFRGVLTGVPLYEGATGPLIGKVG
jgi:circadian clock protein KaiC